MGVLLALASATCYGLADFFGGLLSRRASSSAIALIGQAGGLVAAVIGAILVPASSLAASDLGWGALSGVGTGAGMLFLYRGLSRGDMSVVVPLSAVGGLALPVLVSVAVLGDRPSAWGWSGIVLSCPALWFVSRSQAFGTSPGAAGTGDGLLASVGIAVQYLALAQAGVGSGLWPVVAGRVAAVLAIAPVVARTAASMRPPPAVVGQAAVNGGIAALALVCYLVATRFDLVSIAVVLSSLYPAIPVLLGILALRERLGPIQVIGLLCAGLAIALCSA